MYPKQEIKFSQKFQITRKYNKYYKNSKLVDEIFNVFANFHHKQYTLVEIEEKTCIPHKVLCKWRNSYEKNPKYRPGKLIGKHRMKFTLEQEKEVADFIRVQFLLHGIIIKRKQMRDLLFDCWKSFHLDSGINPKKNFFSYHFTQDFCKRNLSSFRKMRKKNRSNLKPNEVSKYLKALWK